MKPALTTLGGRFAVCRLGPDAATPAWATGSLVSITRTRRELSVVCRAEAVPPGVTAETDWRVLEVAGPLSFAATGIIEAVARPLADRRIPVFVISTYDTDYVLVRDRTLAAATAALRGAGHRVDDEGGARPAGSPTPAEVDRV
ncbi:MAG TPA: ACT domain-containing protein [Solirubrobacteraceae bacterium]|jgi:hypothetical protein|nr:ACT domain-containing protein [Solirubrobacteraceae bacterium]